MICSGRDKIESATDLAKAVDTAQKLNLDALVVVGGDDSNTNAAVLAEHFLSKGTSTAAHGVYRYAITSLSGRTEQIQPMFAHRTYRPYPPFNLR